MDIFFYRLHWDRDKRNQQVDSVERLKNELIDTGIINLKNNDIFAMVYNFASKCGDKEIIQFLKILP